MGAIDEKKCYRLLSRANGQSPKWPWLAVPGAEPMRFTVNTSTLPLPKNVPPEDADALHLCSMSEPFIEAALAHADRRLPLFVAHDGLWRRRIEMLKRRFNALELPTFLGEFDVPVNLLLMLRSQYLVANPISELSWIVMIMR